MNVKQLVEQKQIKLPSVNRGVIKYLYATSNIAAIHIHVQVMQYIDLKAADLVYMQREFSFLTLFFLSYI